MGNDSVCKQKQIDLSLKCLLSGETTTLSKNIKWIYFGVCIFSPILACLFADHDTNSRVYSFF